MADNHGISRINWLKPVLCLALGLMVLLAAWPGLAAPKELTNIAISDFKITRENGDDITGPINVNNRIRLNLNWDASSYGMNVNEGDYFEIKLPNELIATNLPGNREFNLYDGSNVIAKGVITVGSGGRGGVVRVTFNDYVNGKGNIKGNLYWIATIVNEPGNIGPDETFTITFGDQPFTSLPIEIKPAPIDNISKEKFRKWIGVVVDDPYHINWTIRINAMETPMSNIVVDDQLLQLDGEADITYVLGSFTLRRVLYTHNADGERTGVEPGFNETPVDASLYTLVIADDLKSFKFTMAATELAKDGRHFTYLLRYQTTADPNKRARNQAIGQYNGLSPQEFQTSYLAQQAGGGGSGEFTVFTAAKRWRNGPATDHTAVPLILMRNGVPMPSAPEPEITGTAPDFNYMWKQLLIRDPETKELYTYSAKEAGADDGTTEVNGNTYDVTKVGNTIINTFSPPSSLPRPGWVGQLLIIRPLSLSCCWAAWPWTPSQRWSSLQQTEHRTVSPIPGPTCLKPIRMEIFSFTPWKRKA